MKVFLTIVVLLLVSPAIGQEILHKIDGTTDTVKVIEINLEEIVYKQWGRLDGPRYHIPRDQVSHIVFKDGSIEIITKTQADDKLPIDATVYKINRNLFTLNCAAFLLGDVNIGYERLRKDRRSGIRLNINHHIKDMGPLNEEWYRFTKVYAARIDFTIYPTKHKLVRYFLGPSLRIARFVGPARSPSSAFFGVDNGEVSYNSFGLLFVNGFQARISGAFHVGMMAGIGVGIGNQTGNSNSYAGSEGMFAFNVGFSF